MSIVQNYLIFFMILTINLQDHVEYIYEIFKGNSSFFYKLVKVICSTPPDKKRVLLGILSHIFLIEYKDCFFHKENNELENIFVKQNEFFTSVFNEPLSPYENQTYIKMFGVLERFDLSYDNFFKNKKNIVDDDDRPAYKLCIAQSVIRVAFSKEKSLINSQYFEFNFLSTVIEKDMRETRQTYGDDVKTLFRKEDLCDDIIKYMFFLFGNAMLIESFVKPFQNFVKGIKHPKKKTEITMDEFINLMGTIVKNVTLTLPYVLKVMLKLVYIYAKKYFTLKEGNYSPLYTLVFFNFMISPRVQSVYGITIEKYGFLRTLNRLIRNTCYNFHFLETDELYKFNVKIEMFHNQLKTYVEDKIMSINTECDTVKDSLSYLFKENYLVYPKFLFYWDSQLLCEACEGGVNTLLEFQDLDNH